MQGVRSENNIWYSNIEPLVIGGNSVAFLIYSTSGSNKGIPLSLKVFRNIYNKDRRESFLKEIDFLQSSDHPSVMKIYDKGVFGRENTNIHL